MGNLCNKKSRKGSKIEIPGFDQNEKVEFEVFLGNFQGTGIKLVILQDCM